MNKFENSKALVKGTAVSAEQFALVKDIIKMYKGETRLTRTQIKQAHADLRGAKASPYFIVKNMACKTKERGVYNLNVLRQKAEPKPKAVKTEKALTVAANN